MLSGLSLGGRFIYTTSLTLQLLFCLPTKAHARYPTTIRRSFIAPSNAPPLLMLPKQEAPRMLYLPVKLELVQ
jgi:hypothetical protein